jgi:hypothetical protein
MPVITKQQIQKMREMEEPSAPIKQEKKETPLGRCPFPVMKPLKQEHQPQISNTKKYKEYRDGLLLIATDKMGLEGSQKNKFIDDIMNSKYLKELLFDVSVLQSIDAIDGVPKILLTIASKYFASKSL